VGARAINALTCCKVIARYGTGVDIVDVDAARRRGILVTNVPNDWCQNEVVDHAMALLLAATRKICGYDRATATRRTTRKKRAARSATLQHARRCGC
jgi:D-3-phosphoglycerate dehydrogenase / 2-oxoglutarate reductase